MSEEVNNNSLLTRRGYDWCENNEVVVKGVSEFGNTITCLFYIMYAIYGFYWIYKMNIPHFIRTQLTILCSLIFFIGVGTGIYHATLTYFGELIDEFSISLFVIYSSYIIDIYVFGRIFLGTCIFLITQFITTFIAALFPPATTNIALIALGFSLVFRGLYITYKMKKPSIPPNIHKEYKLIFNTNIAILGLAITIWVPEHFICSESNVFQIFHSIWHLLTAISCHLTLKYIFYLLRYYSIKPETLRYYFYGENNNLYDFKESQNKIKSILLYPQITLGKLNERQRVTSSTNLKDLGHFV